jgi:steroid delta-isomerase-like uncharacterized protein
MTRTERIVFEYGAAKNRHDPRTVLERCTDDFALEIVPLGERIEGKERVLEYLERFLRSFPDYAGESDTKVASGDVVMALWTLRGTLRGEFLGMPPTGRAVAVPAVSVYFLRGGKLRCERIFFDVATLLAQAGLPMHAPPGQAAAACGGVARGLDAG